jgi:uncharacterized damage-inducible protein DinB
MKICIALIPIGLAVAPALHAQTTAKPVAPPPPVVTTNPVVWSAKEIVTRQAKYIAAAAEQMPADKYSYHPTPDQWTYGKIVAHVTQANFAVCAMLSDTPAPQGMKIAETDSKETLRASLKASFESCDKALANLQDSRLGDTITYFRGAKVPRARALVELTDDLEDHYSQMASYLRLNGMIPPSAKPQK